MKKIGWMGHSLLPDIAGFQFLDGRTVHMEQGTGSLKRVVALEYFVKTWDLSGTRQEPVWLTSYGRGGEQHWSAAQGTGHGSGGGRLVLLRPAQWTRPVGQWARCQHYSEPSCQPVENWR